MCKNHLMDLKATRCPTAMLIIRRAIDSAKSEEFVGKVTIRTIEMSAERDVTYYLAQVEGVEVSAVETNVLPNHLVDEWIESGEAITCELKGVSTYHDIELLFT